MLVQRLPTLRSKFNNLVVLIGGKVVEVEIYRVYGLVVPTNLIMQMRRHTHAGIANQANNLTTLYLLPSSGNNLTLMSIERFITKSMVNNYCISIPA